MVNYKVNGHSTVVWHWSGDPMVPRSNPLLVKKFLLLSLLIWKGGFEILPNNTWDLLKKAYGTSKKLRFQFRGQLNKPFSEPTYLYTNLTLGYFTQANFHFLWATFPMPRPSWATFPRAASPRLPSPASSSGQPSPPSVPAHSSRAKPWLPQKKKMPELCSFP